MTDAEARVRAVLRAAARIADPKDLLGREAREALPASTGLSAAGVELGLARLETSASDEEVRSLVAAVASAPRVHVVPPSNVFIAASRAVALGLAGAADVVVRPSRREPIFPAILVRALADEGVSVTMARDLDPRPGDHVHAYGRDATIEAIAERAASDVVVWGHGSGFGLVVLDGGGDTRALAEDVAVFDQRGCLSPRIVVFRGSAAEAEAFAVALAASLADFAQDVPVGRVDAPDRAAERAYLDAMRMAGDVFGGPGAHVALDPDPRALVLPDGPRVVHVARVDDVERATALAGPLARFVVSASGEGPFFDAVSSTFPRARRARVGAMQRPPFDGPVDLRSASADASRPGRYSGA